MNQKKVVIVESPGKIKTIQKYLGSTYLVVSSNGHIRDLPQKNLGIDIDKDFQPSYVMDERKKQQITMLKKATKNASLVLLASDDDREGEAIAWHIQQTLQLPQEKYVRIVFQSITKSAIDKAIQNPRHLDQARIDAQQARRILDRLVGYQLSPLLWQFLKSGLSAGRVQSVAVRLIVEKEREIMRFTPKEKGQVKAIFLLPDAQELKAEMPKDFEHYIEAKTFVQNCKNATFHIAKIQKTTTVKSPPPPLMTSTLQQSAIQELGFSIDKTTVLAQKLYESGHVTYIRTDSLQLSEEALLDAQNVITQTYGESYHKKRVYKTKSSTAQEAHEAIRPTSFATITASQDKDTQRLYTLIRNRAVASQMADAKINKTTAVVAISTLDTTMVAKGEILDFPGFYLAFQTEKQQKQLPETTVGQTLQLQEMTARQNFTKPPARYNEATLVKQLETLGIGRPSTYRPIISTIQQRGYVEKTSREGNKRCYACIKLQNQTLLETQEEEIVDTIKERLLPTSIGMLVNDFLMQHFTDIMNYTFTAQTEEKLDQIATNTLPWQEMIKNFYMPFSEKIHTTKGNKNEQVEQLKVRKIGDDPASKKPIYARMSRRYGPMVQLGDFEQEEKPRFASLTQDQLLETITLEEALALFKMPRVVGTFEEMPISAHIGRFGPYIKHKEITISIKGHDPLTITQEVAITIIEQKRKENQPLKTFANDPDIEIRQGRFGPYIKTPTLNVRIPKNKTPEALTLQECKVLIEEAIEKKKPKGKTKESKRT